MTKLLLVTDAWHPQINGVVTALAKMKDHLERDGCEVVVIHPGLFRCVPLPRYPEIRLAMSAGATVSYQALNRSLATHRRRTAVLSERPSS